MQMRSMLVAIDLSELSSRVLGYASSLALAWQARLLVVHVVYDLAYFTSIYHADASLPALQQRLEAEAYEHLEALCQSYIDAQVSYETLVLTDRPVVAIHELVRQHAVECLVLGAHSTDKMEHQLFGSTAERLLHQISCPIFIIPPYKESTFISHG